ncbi:MAG: hypothetical protein ABW199_11840, partial [Caulobacterales bacterium]
MSGQSPTTPTPPENAENPKPRKPRKRAAAAAALSSPETVSAPKKTAPRKPRTKTAPAAVIAAEPPPRAPPPKEAPAASSKPKPLAEVVAGQNLNSLAELSRNLGEVITRANQVFSTALIDQTRSGAGAAVAQNPDPFGIGPALNSVWTSLAMHPETLRDAHASLWQRYFDIWMRYTQAALTGAPLTSIQVGSRDKRFKDPEWSANPHFGMLRETYLATADFITTLVERADVDHRTKQKAAFFIRQAVDAASPSNFLLTNPTALRALVETHG